MSVLLIPLLSHCYWLAAGKSWLDVSSLALRVHLCCAGRVAVAIQLRSMDAEVIAISRLLAVRTLQLEMEYIYISLEDEAIDVSADELLNNPKGEQHCLLHWRAGVTAQRAAASTVCTTTNCSIAAGLGGRLGMLWCLSVLKAEHRVRVHLAGWRR